MERKCADLLFHTSHLIEELVSTEIEIKNKYSPDTLPTPEKKNRSIHTALVNHNGVTYEAMFSFRALRTIEHI